MFLLVQVAASSNVIPLETAPSALQTLNGVMPLTAFVNGASQLVSGGQVGSYVAVVVVLLVWALIGYALLVSAVKKRQDARPAAAGTRGAQSRVSPATAQKSWGWVKNPSGS